MAGCLKGSPTGFSLLGLREVLPDQTGVEQWKELLLNTGGTHLTLQDIKLPEGCTSGGFCFSDSSSLVTRNRFICWQISNDILELVEHSLDLNLHGNSLRIRFQGLAILEGTSIFETKNNVVILVSTISSVHRLVLPHPSKHNDPASISSSSNISVPSIFSEASLPWLRDCASYQIMNSTTTNVSLPTTAASCLFGNGKESLFAVANPSSISLIRMGQTASAVTTSTLQPSSNLSRLISGYLPTVLRGSSTHENEDNTASLCLLPINDDILVLALSKGLKLRIWSALNQECRLDCDLVEYFGDKSIKQLGSLHRIRYCPDGNDYKLAVFSSFGKKRSFLHLDLQTNPAVKINYLSTVTAQHSRLIDFSLTSTHIYALWSTSQGQHLLEFAETSRLEWQQVALEPGVEQDIEYDDSIVDPKQAYLEALFKPGVFSVATLTKALQAFDRSGATKRRRLMDVREDIVAAIETELQDQISDDMTEEEYLQLSAKSWAQFYDNVVQYHLKRPVPVGLLIDEATGFHALLKRGMVSFLRPLDLVEGLILQRGRHWDEPPYSNAITQLFGQPTSTGLMALLKVLFLVSDALSNEQMKRFDHSMFQLQSADQIARQLADELLECDSLNLLDGMQMALSSVDVYMALSCLLQQLSVGMSGAADNKLTDNQFSGNSPFRLLFNGSLGLGALAESSRQMADLRLGLCRDILIVQQLLILAQEKLQLISVDAETIRSEFLPRSVPLAHAYYALSWLCHCPAQTVSNALIEQNIRTMALLGFKRSPESSGIAGKSLVEFFLSSDGGRTVRDIVLQEEDTSEWTSAWLDVFPHFMKAIGQLLWPIGNHTTLMEFLMERFQPAAIQGYVRLQQNWCEWNTCSRKFLMAVALVATGEGDKASRWMLEAAEGIVKEQLLHSIITKTTSDGENSRSGSPFMRFHLLCVQVLEQAGLCSAALRVALVALNSSPDDDPLLATMWSIVAKLHLSLGHYQDAYEAIVSNPDSSQRPDSLGRLVNILLERKQMDILLSFPYAGLESDLEKIVERRARSSDVLSMKLYYSFLYAFHVRQGKMRKAAAVMHEQALRYGCEGESALMVKCLLACLNALRLVSRQEAWLVKPVSASQRPQDGSTRSARQTVDVIEYTDIEKEYELSYACLSLNQSITSLSPTDVVSLLTSRCHYQSALRIARIFDVKDTSSIVEHLAANCVALSRESANEDDAWIWLAENQSSGVGKASEQAWRLLERTLPEAEGNDNQTRCHRAAARKILGLDCTLPYWLTASYKLRNPGELISVYHQAGLLEDAAQVALELVDAVLGKGKEYFGFTSDPLQINAPPVWLPYTVLDRLILELEANSNDPTYKTLLKEIRSKLDVYFTTAENVSRSFVELAMS